MDIVLLMFFSVIVFIVIVDLMFGNEGTKGITSKYKTKSGVTRTAKKERSDHIVWKGWLAVVFVVY